MNRLFQELNQQQKQIQPSNQKSSQLRSNDLFKKMLKSSNPNELVNSIISSNPKLQSVMQLFNSSGMTPKQFFYNYAQQQGINPDDFINSLRNEKG